MLLDSRVAARKGGHPYSFFSVAYRILPHSTASYRILPHFTAFYRLGGRYPIVERKTIG